MDKRKKSIFETPPDVWPPRKSNPRLERDCFGFHLIIFNLKFLFDTSDNSHNVALNVIYAVEIWLVFNLFLNRDKENAKVRMVSQFNILGKLNFITCRRNKEVIAKRDEHNETLFALTYFSSLVT